MKKLITGLITLSIMILLGASPAFAAPTPETPVVDTTRTLTPEQIDTISHTINNQVDDPDVAQIAVLLTDKIPQGETLEEASRRTLLEWGLGSKKRHNGVLLYIAKQDRKLRIETTEGISGALPDILVKDIINKTITPEFKKDNYAEGINAGTKRIREATLNPDYAVEFEKDNQFPWSAIGISIAIILSIIAAGFLIMILNRALQIREQQKKILRLENKILEFFSMNSERILEALAEEKEIVAKQKQTSLNRIEAENKKLAAMTEEEKRTAAESLAWSELADEYSADNNYQQSAYDKLKRTIVKNWNTSIPAPAIIHSEVEDKIEEEERASRRRSPAYGYRTRRSSSNYSGGYYSGGFGSSSYSGGFGGGSSFGGGGGADGGGSSGGW